MKSVPEVSTATTSDASSSLHRWRNDIGPRYQWNHNYGYCGEVSEISAGLYYGQYLSQYDARAAADDAPQNRYRSQLLLGVNALRAAETMHLRAIARTGRSNRSADDFLAWVKENVLLGRPVAIGIYMNQFRFYGNRNPNAGSPQYDHIVPVIGIESSHPRDERGYFPDDTITFSDNGEWSSSRRDAQYYFSYAFGAFQKTRRQANAHHGPIYSLTDDHRDFGIAILGVQDEDERDAPGAGDDEYQLRASADCRGVSQAPSAGASGADDYGFGTDAGSEIRPLSLQYASVDSGRRASTSTRRRPTRSGLSPGVPTASSS